jgi:arsenate reductase
MKKIIFVCTGNSCRSQMAHGLFRKMCNGKFEVFSAGSHPSRVHPAAIKVMDEVEIDISHHTSDNIKIFRDKNIDIVVTVCDNADKECPVFPGKIQRIHWSIADPFKKWSYDENDLNVFRTTREVLKEKISDLLKTI